MKNRLRKRKQKKNMYEHRYPEKDYDLPNLKDNKIDRSMELNPFDERKIDDESDIDMQDLGAVRDKDREELGAVGGKDRGELGAVGGKKLKFDYSDESDGSSEDDGDDPTIFQKQQEFEDDINTKFDDDIRTLVSKRKEYLSKLNDYLRIKIEDNETFLNKGKKILPDPMPIGKLLPAITNLQKTILADMKSNRTLIQYTLQNTNEALMKLPKSASKDRIILNKKYQNLEEDLYELLQRENNVKSIDFYDGTSMIRDEIVTIQREIAAKNISLKEELKKSGQRSNSKKILRIETEILKLISEKENLQKETGDKILYKTSISKIPKYSSLKKPTMTGYGAYVGT